MTLQTAGLWLYSAMASLVFGATVYEALVVHPAWSRKPGAALDRAQLDPRRADCGLVVRSVRPRPIPN
jgi:hypothetical protein